ncbi:1-phosphatidylinositol -bisphosphate phosphodiesterase eta-1 [Limosa lapponica baueri]|uniref:1-phosphatidylinositol-bisphosphate phosphodiesterase eta-1 n=1 Tax=Limosa lapponica baueri TaxID=1758121 RepID=A0A2I0TEQ0_LIMLA|nr:1-phosphatidylinositol -bisphosphate phosphodiesterase eta-1 [Limosa lapponica baueri]
MNYSNGATEHQVESFIRTKLESLIKESQIRDKEDPDSFTVRALLKATHEGLNVNLKQIIDPFVEVEIIGLPVDCCKDQTRVVDDNGFNPVWEETLTFTIHMPEIALVRFLVWDHDPIGRDFVGQRTLPFSSLVPGYRHVYLEGLTEASIFVHITINEIYGKWSPLILNPSYTILHFLGATKNKQLIGLRGLFNKNPKHNSAETSGHYVRKRSIGDRILRRTASAPAKGRKKSKMGFLEGTEIKDSASEPVDLKEKEGVVRRTSRSLQARPASMPVDKYLLVGLPCPEDETTQDAKGKENASANSDDNTNEEETSLKESVFTCSEKTANTSNLASQFKKNDGEETTVDSLVPPLQEQPETLVFASGVAETNHLIGYQENNLSDATVPLMKDSDYEISTEKTNGENCADSKKDDDTKGSKEEKITLMGTCLSQKVEMENHRYEIIEKSTGASLSLTDISSAICRDVPDLHSTLTMQDSDISRLIDEVSLANESEMDSAVSALIGQFDVTDDQTNLTVVPSLHGANSQTFSVMATHPHVLTADLNSPCKHNFTPTKSVKSPLFSTPDTTMFSSPETAEYSVYTIIHEATLTPASECKTHSELVCKKKLNSVENNLPRSPCPSSLSLLNADPKRKCGTKSGTSWEAPKTASSFACNSLIFEEALVDPPTGENSESSSLVEVDGDYQDLLVTACEYKREDMSQVASPLKLRQKQDAGHGGERTSGSSATVELCAAALDCSGNFRTAGKQLPFPMCENVGFLYHHHHHYSDKQKDVLCTSERSQFNIQSPVLKNALAFPPHSTIKQTSPCKSKSLGDLTSEDISCNFESKYQYISKSFISSGMRDKKLAAMKNMRPHSTDALTEQLRKLVSLDQEDSCQTLYSRQIDEDCPKALVRKLSSRSQSRVRNIASRAKERQEAASKQKSSNTSSIAGVVLRNKPSASPHVVNRHSTGSYIARYLNGFPGEDVEGRGIPEGACAALHYGCSDQLYTHDSVLQLEPSNDDRPEIYFLLRL